MIKLFKKIINQYLHIPEPGEIYQQNWHTDNPFRREGCVEILDVKDGWVKYKFVDNFYIEYPEKNNKYYTKRLDDFEFSYSLTNYKLTDNDVEWKM